MIRRPPRSTLFPTRRSSDLGDQKLAAGEIRQTDAGRSEPQRHQPSVRGRQTAGTLWLAEGSGRARSEEHTSELQSQFHLVCRLLLEKKKKKRHPTKDKN